MKSSIHPPSRDHALNTYRASNPFSPKGSPDWAPIAASQMQYMDARGIIPMKPPVPPRSSTAPVAYQNKPHNALGAKGNVHKKAPPVPPKPNSLGSDQNSTIHNRSQNGDATLSGPTTRQSRRPSLTSGLLDDNVNEEISWKPLVPQ